MMIRLTRLKIPAEIAKPKGVDCSATGKLQAGTVDDILDFVTVYSISSVTTFSIFNLLDARDIDTLLYTHQYFMEPEDLLKFLINRYN